MSKELVNPEDFASASEEFWGDSNLDKNDFAIPRVSIGQATSKSGEPGHFNYNNGQSFKTLQQVRLIVPKKTRVLYGDGASRCKSDNFVQPSPFVKNPISSSCAYCPAAQWGDDDEEKMALAKELGVQEGQRYKPLCNETYNLLMADQYWSPFFISFQKTQLKVVQEKLFSRLKAMRKPPYVVAFDMELNKVTGTNKLYYTVDFLNFTELSDEDVSIGQGIYKQFKDTAEGLLAQQHEEMDQSHKSSEAPMPDAEPPNFDDSEGIPF